MASSSASVSLPVFSVSNKPPFFAHVNRGEPVSTIDKVEQFADSLLSFSCGDAVHFLAPENEKSFKYIERHSAGEGLYRLALKAGLRFALIVLPLARLLHAFWTKQPISAGLVLPLALPAGLFLAKYSFRSDLKFVSVSYSEEKDKSLTTCKAGRFNKDSKLEEGVQYTYDRNKDPEAQIRGGIFNAQGSLIQGFEKDPGRFIYVNPEVWLIAERGLNFLIDSSQIRICQLVSEREGGRKIYKPVEHRTPMEALFEIAQDLSRPSPIRTCIENGKLVKSENPFKALQVIDFLTIKESRYPRFLELSRESLSEFIKLVVEQEQTCSAPAAVIGLFMENNFHSEIPYFLNLGRENLSEFIKLTTKHGTSMQSGQVIKSLTEVPYEGGPPLFWMRLDDDKSFVEFIKFVTARGASLEAVQAIKLLTDAPSGRPPLFCQLNNESFLEFIKLAVKHVEKLSLAQIIKLTDGISEEIIKSQTSENARILKLQKLILIAQAESLHNSVQKS